MFTSFPRLFGILTGPNREKPVYVRLENPKRKFTNNYGDMPQFINKADKDPWDVIVPGYVSLDYNKSYKFKNLLGVYALPNGNHKLIIDVYSDYEREPHKIKNHVKDFTKKYEKHTKLKGSVLFFTTFDGLG